MAYYCLLNQHNKYYGTSSGLEYGYKLVMSNGEAYHDFSNIMISRRKWVGYFSGMFSGGWSGRDESFDNQASRAEVGPGCTLYLYEHKNFTGTGARISNPIGNISNPSHILHGFPKDLHEIGIGDSVSSAHCNCGVDPE
jgi:hypothetical protein